MASITSLNQYKASYADSTDLTVAAETMADAIVALAEAKTGEPSLIQRTVTGIKVAIPAPAIAIKTTVTGSGAVSAGCKATPYTISSVKTEIRFGLLQFRQKDLHSADGILMTSYFLRKKVTKQQLHTLALHQHFSSTKLVLLLCKEDKREKSRCLTFWLGV